ncbi:hypothetical protein [Dictyobacter formicarum]|uniref:Uncharacterized protein n=1 Tax=Dictyobacter formicarum TaxID=2778368 RepID=A0ABQ3VRA2_9CHLR|nr:hypothetical protein [Dictyobacter formicarum]GHO88690.1 hypothetical protein KSZ_66960 [Dictyobacter formicarum]
MPGIPTNFVIADLVFDALRKRGAPQASLLDNANNLPYAYLGAIGASWGDFMAARPEIGAKSPNTPYFQAWLPVLKLIAGAAQGSSPASNGVYRDLKQLRDTLNKLGGVIKDKKKFALLGMQDELNQLNGVINALQKEIGGLSSLRNTIGKAIATGAPSVKVSPSNQWQPRDTLHGSHSGRFLQALQEAADASSDGRLKAYALGATVGYAAALCGNPYVNNVVGAPYRNHWWRHRWIETHIDTWVHGYYASGGSSTVQFDNNDIPTPLYTNWPNLCEANLHKRIELPGIDLDSILQSLHDGTASPAVLPQVFLDYWKNAYTKAYGPIAATVTSGIDDMGLQSAYAMTWLVLWLQTSGEVIPCMPPDQSNGPDNCGARPPWVAADGSVVVGGTVTPPPQPAKDTNPSVPEIVSGILLAMLGVVQLMTGYLSGGIADIVAAVALVADGVTDPDWEQLRCYQGWVMVFFYSLTNALHDMLKWSGLSFPYTMELAHDQFARQFGGKIEPTDAALNTARSRRRENGTYPASHWNPPPPPNASNWPNPPTEPVELPAETIYPFDLTWPFHFVDGLQFASTTMPPKQINPLFSLTSVPPAPPAPPLVHDKNEWQARRDRINKANATNEFFGNAVDVSLELLLSTQPAEFLDWDLDGDAGIGFPTWLLPTPGAARSAAIPEPEP